MGRLQLASTFAEPRAIVALLKCLLLHTTAAIVVSSVSIRSDNHLVPIYKVCRFPIKSPSPLLGQSWGIFDILQMVKQKFHLF